MPNASSFMTTWHGIHKHVFGATDSYDVND
jgi:hypothetical protein